MRRRVEQAWRVQWFVVRVRGGESCGCISSGDARMRRHEVERDFRYARLRSDCVSLLISSREKFKNQVLTQLPHHVRIDGCMCGMRESMKAELVRSPLNNSIQLGSSQGMVSRIAMQSSVSPRFGTVILSETLGEESRPRNHAV